MFGWRLIIPNRNNNSIGLFLSAYFRGMKYFRLFGLFIDISYKYLVVAIGVIVLLASCSTLEKASIHGLNSGYYKFKSEDKKVQHVDLDLTNEHIDAYHHINRQPEKKQFLSIPFNTPMLLRHIAPGVDPGYRRWHRF
jgi:hypothetical protein